MLVVCRLAIVATAAAAGAAAAVATVAATQDAPAPSRPAHERRGDDVEATYLAFVDRLERYQRRLRTALDRDAPDLAAVLGDDPPAAVAYGYQLTPRLTPGKTAAAARRPVSVSYSWRRTQDIIDAQVTRLAADALDLDRTTDLDPAARRVVYTRLVTSYELLAANQAIADQHVKHNRFWQREVDADPARFARLTALHDTVLEREHLLAALADDATPPDRRTALERRAAELDVTVRDGLPPPTPPRFVTAHDDGAGGVVLRVPLYTDIADDAFLAAAEGAIEEAWTVDTGAARYRVDIDLRRTTPVRLYGEAPAPSVGDHLDLTAHVARFPDDGGVLTTGANRTYAIVGRFVAFGPGEIRGNTIAHEFGHILGFTDRYLRGARARGDAGHEIVEIVPDPDDIMAAAGSGDVGAAHFEQLLAQRR